MTKVSRRMNKSTKQKKQPKMTKVRSLDDLRQRAKDDERYQRLCIVGLTNLGCEHLAEMQRRYRPVKWEAYWQGLIEYVTALVGEYQESEDQAFTDVRDEVNHVLDCIDQANLEWED